MLLCTQTVGEEETIEVERKIQAPFILIRSLLFSSTTDRPKPSCMTPSDTNSESSLGIRLLPKLSQEMVEQANYLTGNIIHFKIRLWGTLQSAECLKKERDTEAAGTRGVESRIDSTQTQVYPALCTTFICWGVIMWR